MHYFCKSRSLGTFLALLVSALLLSSWKDASTKGLANHQPPDAITLPPNTLSAEDVALPFSRSDFPANLSYSHSPHIIHKRARALEYNTAVCKGHASYQQILAAFEGTGTPGPEFSEQDMRNGWSRDDEHGGVDPSWEEAFKGTYGRVPTDAESFLIDMNLFKGFKNVNGDMVTGNVGRPQDDRQSAR